MSLKHANDCEVRPSKENGLAAKNRILLGYIQPIMKSALEKKFGQFSDWEWRTICAHVLSNIDR
jgi:hypothetical protein